LETADVSPAAKRAWGVLCAACLLLSIGVGAGCRVVQSTAEIVTPQSKKPATNPAEELQDKLMRFADGFSGAMINGIAAFGTSTNPLPAQQILHLQITYLSDTLAIATGPNPVSDLLDMTVLVTLSRMTLEKHWLPLRHDEQTLALLTLCKQSESEIWQMAATLLTSQQQSELRAAIDNWYEQNSGESRTFYMRALGLASQVQKSSKTQTSGSGNVFSLLGLDPLSGLDPVTREIAESRMAVERAMYSIQRMPQLISLQSQLLTMQLLALPTVQQVVSNSTEISSSAARLSDLAENLPSRLEADQAQLKGLLDQSHQTLDAGRQMSDSLNTTLKTFDALMKRFGVGEPSTSPPDTNSPPFNILDYAKTADQLALASKQLEALLLAFNNTLDSTAWNQRLQDFDAVSRRTQKEADAVLNHAFFVGAMLIVVAFGCTFIYRLIMIKVIKAPR
jgi:hypothetical protein